MRVNIFLLLLALALSGLAFYGFHSCTDNLLFSLGSALLCLVYLSAAMAFYTKESPRSGAMVKLVSGIFTGVVLLLNVFFVWKNVSDVTYIVTNGILLCVWAVTVYGIGRARQ